MLKNTIRFTNDWITGGADIVLTYQQYVIQVSVVILDCKLF
ncbi:hypothetical protein [Acinetobacter phage Ab69]|nr:hypothetical protein [Acinetobacter phage Ab69]